MKNLILISLLLVMAACTALLPAPVDKIATLPIIHVGSPPPDNTEYVTYFPAGSIFPLTLKASGSLLAQPKMLTGNVTLSRDLYLYQYWASHDGRVWQHSHELLAVEYSGGFDINGLSAAIKLDMK